MIEPAALRQKWDIRQVVEIRRRADSLDAIEQGQPAQAHVERDRGRVDALPGVRLAVVEDGDLRRGTAVRESERIVVNPLGVGGQVGDGGVAEPLQRARATLSIPEIEPPERGVVRQRGSEIAAEHRDRLALAEGLGHHLRQERAVIVLVEEELVVEAEAIDNIPGTHIPAGAPARVIVRRRHVEIEVGRPARPGHGGVPGEERQVGVELR